MRHGSLNSLFQVDDETKKMAGKYPKLKDSFDILNEKYLEAEQRLEKMEKQVESRFSPIFYMIKLVESTRMRFRV